MNNNRKISRRDFLKLLAAGSTTAVGGYMLSEFAPWLDYEEQVTETWTAQNFSAPLMTLVHSATQAANGHNTQPWKFSIKDNTIEIHPDTSRRLPVVGPHDREMWISLGCALENMLVAARASGYAAEVTYPDQADFIHIQLTSDTRKAARCSMPSHCARIRARPTMTA